MVAARRPAPKKRPGLRSKNCGNVSDGDSESMYLKSWAERKMTVARGRCGTAAVRPELRRGDRPPVTDEKVNVQTELSRIITLVGEEAVSAQEARIGYNLERYMVWKDMNGAIGVSNVQFPDRTDMFVALQNNWYNVKRRQPQGFAVNGGEQGVF